MTDLLYKDEVYAIVGAAMEVYNVLFPGFLEPVLKEAVGIEFTSRGIPFFKQKELHISYKAHRLEQKYKADFVVYGKIIIEIKALDYLTSREEAQLLNYLKATGWEVGVLINFGSDGKLEWKRRVLTRKSSAKNEKSQNEF